MEIHQPAQVPSVSHFAGWHKRFQAKHARSWDAASKGELELLGAAILMEDELGWEQLKQVNVKRGSWNFTQTIEVLEQCEQ